MLVGGADVGGALVDEGSLVVGLGAFDVLCEGWGSVVVGDGPGSDVVGTGAEVVSDGAELPVSDGLGDPVSGGAPPPC